MAAAALLACETFPLLLSAASTSAALAVLACATFPLLALSACTAAALRFDDCATFPPLLLVELAVAMLPPAACAVALLDSAAAAAARLPGLFDVLHVLPTPTLTVTPWTLTHESPAAPPAGASAIPVARAPTVIATPIDARRARRTKVRAENALPMSVALRHPLVGLTQAGRTAFGSQGSRAERPLSRAECPEISP